MHVHARSRGTAAIFDHTSLLIEPRIEARLSLQPDDMPLVLLDIVSDGVELNLTMTAWEAIRLRKTATSVILELPVEQYQKALCQLKKSEATT